MSTTEMPGSAGGGTPELPVTDVPAAPPAHLQRGGPGHSTEPLPRLARESKGAARREVEDGPATADAAEPETDAGTEPETDVDAWPASAADAEPDAEPGLEPDPGLDPEPALTERFADNDEVSGFDDDFGAAGAGEDDPDGAFDPAAYSSADPADLGESASESGEFGEIGETYDGTGEIDETSIAYEPDGSAMPGLTGPAYETYDAADGDSAGSATDNGYETYESGDHSYESDDAYGTYEPGQWYETADELDEADDPADDPAEDGTYGDGGDGSAGDDPDRAEGDPAEVHELTFGPVAHGYPPRSGGSRPARPAAATGSASTGSASTGSAAATSAGSDGPGAGTEPSPWQRSYAAWQRAGVGWQPIEGDRRPREPRTGGARAAVRRLAPAPARTTAPARTGVSDEAPAAAPAPAAPASPAPAATRGTFDRISVPAPPRPEAGSGAAAAHRSSGRRIGLVAAVAVAVAIAGGGAYALVRDDPQAAPGGGATVSDWLFAADPTATTDGRSQELRSVAAAGGTIVAVGAETGGDYFRGQFLVSQDGGRGWQVAQVRTPDGGEPAPGEYPEQVVGGPGRWTALGGSETRRVIWSSQDGRTWTRLADNAASGFQPGDRVTGLARTSSGYVAAGMATRNGRTRVPARAVAWTSADGRTWRRLSAAAFKAKGGQVVRIEQVAARGATVVALGTVARNAAKSGRRQGKRGAEREAFWRSADGGATWAPVKVPQAQGSFGPVAGVVAGAGGFFAARDAKGGKGGQRRARTRRHAVVLRSADGARWTPAGQLRADGYTGLDRLAGGDSGLAALVTVRGGTTLVFRSGDGASWRQSGQYEPRDRRSLTGVAVTPGTTVVTGRQGAAEGTDAFLYVAGGAGAVDLGRVPDAVHAERRVTEVAAYGGQAVAVGSANGQAAAWTTQDGSTWTRSTAVGTVFTGTGQQRLHDVVRGGPGWLAVGSGDGGERNPLVALSRDGRRWRATGGGAFDRRGKGEAVPYGTAYGPHGYVVVGERVVKGRSAAVAWHSVDAAGWAGPAEAGRAGSSMRDVAAGPFGYAAVGTQVKGGRPQPATWTSADGKKWPAATPPPLPPGAPGGGLDRIVASGNTLLAAGWALNPRGPGGTVAYVAVSADGGKSWRLPVLPRGESAGPVTAAAATPAGFVVAAVTGAGNSDKVAVWASPDGRSWRARHPGGRGLSGPGTHRLTGLTAYQGSLLAVGFSGDHRRDLPLLWKSPLR